MDCKTVTVIVIILIVLLYLSQEKSEQFINRGGSTNNTIDPQPMTTNPILDNQHYEFTNSELIEEDTSKKSVDFDINGNDVMYSNAEPLNESNNNSAVKMNNTELQNYNVKDFLPVEDNKNWFDTDFSQAKHNIKDNKLINVDRYVVGVNTVGQSLKNPTYDIRGTVPNPKTSVSPWNNSTYEPDYNLKPLC